MTADASTLLGQVTWSEEAGSLLDILKSHELPLLVKVQKGQYLNVGPGGISSLGVHHHTLLLTSGGRRKRLVAQGIKFKDSRRLVPVGQKLLIPDTFDGFFEILNEEGRAVRAIESVAELARLFPDSCIVRCSCKAYVSKSDSVDTITERSRTIHSGETLVLVGEVSRARGRGPSRFLRCFDSSGENVYLPLEQKVKVSAVAKEENISGVHSIGNLLNKCLPLNVRLVSGRPPEGSRLGSAAFVPEIRLHTAYEDELVVAMPLLKDTVTVAMPRTAQIRVQVAANSEQLAQTAEFARLCDRAAQVWLHAVDRIHPFDVPLPKDPRVDGKVRQAAQPRPRPNRRSISQPMSRVTRIHSGETVDEYDEIDQIYDYVRGFAPLPKNMRPVAVSGKTPGQSAPRPEQRGPERGESDYQQPKLPHRKADGRGADTHRGPAGRVVVGAARSEQPPEPPPIETIPSRRLSLSTVRPFNLNPGVFTACANKKFQVPGPGADSRGADEKRARVTARPLVKQTSVGGETKSPGGKLFTKNCNARANQRFAAPKGPVKAGSVHRYPLPDAVRSTGQLFDLRYKSLTNLAMESGGTLNSSNSGGKVSGDSADSAALLKHSRSPDKRSRKLSRPKSMTNLAWDLHKTPPDEIQKPSIITDHERKLRLEPGVYSRQNNSNVLLTNKYNNLKKIGTLYL